MNFLKTLLASVMGTFIGISLLLLILTIALITSSSQPEPYIRSNTVLTIELSGNIPPRTAQDPLRELLSGESDRASLELLKANLEKAATDDRIAGIWLKINRLSSSWATLETARHYIETFREKSGKFVFASTDDLGMNESAYFLASAADSIFSPPDTFFELNGFSIQTSYYKEMLEKIGVEPEIARVGSYKSAVEPFLRTESSPENREQLLALLNSVSETFVAAVAESRGVDAGHIHEMMNDIPANSVESAYRSGLIDAIAHTHEVEKELRNRLNLEENESLRTVGLGRYSRSTARSAGLERDEGDGRVAVIYASGMIIPQAVTSPFNSNPVITAATIRKSLQAALDHDDVKAIVLHIDSGGGAVSTSELIRAEVREASVKKPVIAYMGSVAASGGYYIAMGADSVMASPNTITGSIGIYNMMFDTSELYNDRLGIYFDTFKTHEHADLTSMTRPLTDFERAALQRSVENGYESFLEHVAESRNMSRDQVHEMSQGRVWTGREAQEIGLVDLLGSLDEAIAAAAGMAGIEKYGVVTYPERKELFDMLFQSADVSVRGWISSLLPWSDEIRHIDDLIRHHSGMHWAILPVRFTIE